VKIIFLATTVLALGALVGCMPAATTGTDAGDAEPYQYKGRADPLMAASASDRATKLSERFKLIQARQ